MMPCFLRTLSLLQSTGVTFFASRSAATWTTVISGSLGSAAALSSAFSAFEQPASGARAITAANNILRMPGSLPGSPEVGDQEEDQDADQAGVLFDARQLAALGDHHDRIVADELA